MTASCSFESVGRNYYKVFIDGGSGSGKTRMGWQLYRRFAAAVTQGAVLVTKTSYLLVAQGPDDPMIHAPAQHVAWRADEDMWHHYEHALADLIVFTLADQEPRHIDASLHSILRCLLGLGSDEHGALVLHIDEFQRTPTETKELLSFVRRFSERHPDTRILTVCTGLYADPHFDGMDDTSPGVFKVHSLNYFTSVQKTWQLARAAGQATAKKQMINLVAALRGVELNDGTQVLVRYLVEDTRGWPIAAAYLGAALQRVAVDGLNEMAVYSHIEEEVYSQLKSMYKVKTLCRMLGHSEPALIKLTLLALSPFTVWTPRGEKG